MQQLLEPRNNKWLTLFLFFDQLISPLEVWLINLEPYLALVGSCTQQKSSDNSCIFHGSGLILFLEHCLELNLFISWILHLHVFPYLLVSWPWPPPSDKHTLVWWVWSFWRWRWLVWSSPPWGQHPVSTGPWWWVSPSWRWGMFEELPNLLQPVKYKISFFCVTKWYQ